jgi:hypothetical protein
MYDGASSLGTQGLTWNNWTNSNVTLTVPYTGYYACMGEAHLNSHSHNDAGDHIQFRLYGSVHGVIVTGPQQGMSAYPQTTYRSWHYCQGALLLSAGEVLTLQMYTYSQNSEPNVTMDNICVRARYMPNPTYPH